MHLVVTQLAMLAHALLASEHSWAFKVQ
jgi:hypothetical protein